ncbi:MAG: PEP-CTERM sorting domain-containing protein [Phycisphaeraceae bacterium]
MRVRAALLTLLASVILAVAAPPMQAALVAWDDFESHAAGSGLSGGAGGAGWTSNWSADPGVLVQNAQVDQGGSRSAEIAGAVNSVSVANRSFATRTTTTYFSVRIEAVAGLENSDFLHFYLGNSTSTINGNNNSGGVGLLSTTTSFLGTRVGTSNGGTTVSSSTTAIQGTTYLLVGKLWKDGSSNFNRIDLFIDPASSTEPVTANATQTGDSGLGGISVFGVRSFNFDSGDIYQFDSVRIGTTFADVIPEPASAALLLGGVLACLNRRRGPSPNAVA